MNNKKQIKYEDINKVKYEGPESNNPLAFKYYDANRIILGKPMKEWLRFSATWWHVFESRGQDPFGEVTMTREWDTLNWKERAKIKVDKAFELMSKLGIEWFCFHDRDLVEEPSDIKEYFARVDEVTDIIAKRIKQTGIKLLWNTSNLFSHQRYAAGAGSSPSLEVFAYAAAQTKHSLDIAKKLNGLGYTFWGGREGYETLLNTNIEQEEKQLASLFKMAVDYADEIGLKDLVFYIEPKAKEPMKHQYDFDASTAIGFLRKYKLEKRFKMNIEQNHALLAGHTFDHELRISRINNALGSIDSNQGDSLLGWDTDQYPYDVYNTTLAMYEVIKMGGFTTGGLNFDAKLRRQSTDLVDHLYAFIMAMDAYAKGLIVAAKLIEDKVFDNFIDQRYESWKTDLGKKILKNQASLSEVATYGTKKNVQTVASGHQEMLEGLLNTYLLREK